MIKNLLWQNKLSYLFTALTMYHQFAVVKDSAQLSSCNISMEHLMIPSSCKYDNNDNLNFHWYRLYVFFNFQQINFTLKTENGSVLHFFTFKVKKYISYCNSGSDFTCGHNERMRFVWTSWHVPDLSVRPCCNSPLYNFVPALPYLHIEWFWIKLKIMVGESSSASQTKCNM